MKSVISQNILGKLIINGREASPQIQMAFKTTTDELCNWRQCDKARFLAIMDEIGLKKEADFIIESL
jgi:hypothetical protein